MVQFCAHEFDEGVLGRDLGFEVRFVMGPWIPKRHKFSRAR